MQTEWLQVLSISSGQACKVDLPEINMSWLPLSWKKCILCNVLLTNSKKYYCIDKETGRRSASRQNLRDKLSNFLEVDVMSIGFQHGLANGTGHLYICESCIISIEGWERATEKKKNWLSKYGLTPGNTSDATTNTCMPASRSVTTSTPSKFLIIIIP